MNENSHAELLQSLEMQLKKWQLRLRRARHGDALQSMIVDRYGSDTINDRQRRFASHAASLDQEQQRLALLTQQLDSTLGLQDALFDRRAVEQDRYAIDQLTGQV